MWPTRAQLDQINLTIFSQKSHQNWPCDREAMLISNKWSKKQPMPKTYISVWSFKRDCSENWYSRTFQVARRKADHHGSGFGHPQPEHPPRPVLHVPRLAQDHTKHHSGSSQGPAIRVCKVCQGQFHANLNIWHLKIHISIVENYIFISIPITQVFPFAKTLGVKVPSKWYRRGVGGLEIICGEHYSSHAQILLPHSIWSIYYSLFHFSHSIFYTFLFLIQDSLSWSISVPNFPFPYIQYPLI